MLSDLNYINSDNAYMLSASVHSVSSTSTYAKYFLPSRYYNSDYSGSKNWYFSIYYYDSEEGTQKMTPYYNTSLIRGSSSGISNSSVAYAIRPIVTLKPSVNFIKDTDVSNVIDWTIS